MDDILDKFPSMEDFYIKFKSILNNTIGSWDLESKDRSLNFEKIKLYLDLLSPEDKHFISFVLNNTTYVTFQQFKKSLIETFENFERSIRQEPFYILLRPDKIGSEHWVIALLWEHILKLNFVNFIDTYDVLDVPSNIVILDDAMYSGMRVSCTIEEFSFDNLDCKYHIVVPYYTSVSIKKIQSKDQKFSLYGTVQQPNITEIPGFAGDKLLEDYNNIARFSLLEPHLTPIYFDHKCADETSTYSTIYMDGIISKTSKYGSLFKIDPSREKVNYLESLFN
jgi:hypothetical protein